MYMGVYLLSTYPWLTIRFAETRSMVGSKPLFQKAIYFTLGSPLRKRAQLVTFKLERRIVAKLPSLVLVQFVQQWYAWGSNGRIIQVDNNCAPLLQFGHGYDHQFWSSVEPISTTSTVHFQSYYLWIQLTPIHKIALILADRASLT